MVLDSIQQGFPVAHDPYGQLASALGVSAEDIHTAVNELRANGIIRRIGGSFDARVLGFTTTLVAVSVASATIETVANIINTFPEVTHNYEREGVYNLWFTIIAENPERIAAICAQIRASAGVQALQTLPASRTFKLRVNFHFAERHDVGCP